MTTVVNFKTDIKVKTQAQKIAERMGLNLSDILNIYLRKFVAGKELHISLVEDESNPSKELIEAIKDARGEHLAGKLKKFGNIDILISHLSRM